MGASTPTPQPGSQPRSAPERSREFVVYEPKASPEGMMVALADEAEAVEKARAELLALYRGHGYRLVDPPIIDSLDSLSAAASPDLRNKTMQLTDPLDGRPLGLRADITPQIARLDARQMDHGRVQRYCYCGSVIHGYRDHIGARRNPCQIGAELFGADSLGADLEIIGLAVETCRRMSFDGLVVDLGHLGIFEGLFSSSGMHGSLRDPLFALLRNKDCRDIDHFLNRYNCAPSLRSLIVETARLYGDVAALDRAREILKDVPGSAEALDHLAEAAAAIAALAGVERVSIDLHNSSCYSYESGLAFAVYSPRSRNELVRGGRYNNIGVSYGRPRGAVGFSGYLNELASLRQMGEPQAIFAPFAPADESLAAEIARLRAEGQTVICGLGVDDEATRSRCHRELRKEGGSWLLDDLPRGGADGQDR